MGSEDNLMMWVMSVAHFVLPGIGNHVYQNIVYRYCICVEVAGRHIEPFL